MGLLVSLTHKILSDGKVQPRVGFAPDLGRNLVQVFPSSEVSTLYAGAQPMSLPSWPRGRIHRQRFRENSGGNFSPNVSSVSSLLASASGQLKKSECAHRKL